MTEQETQVTETAEKASWRQMVVVLLVAFFIILLDQASKYYISATIPYNTSWMPLEWLAPFFQITHIGNTGIAFGL